MITPDDNAKKNYERVKRWREKNRALVNLKQRNYRREKKNLPVPVLAEETDSVKNEVIVVTPTNHCPQAEARESTDESQTGIQKVSDSRGGQNLSGGSDRRAGDENHGRSQEPASPPAQTSKDETLERLRGLIKVEQEKPVVEVPVKPKMVRTETGMLVPDEVWQEREEYKRKSREKGFVPDEYSQA